METPVHFLPDSERLLKTHNAWVADWDGSVNDTAPPDIEQMAREAFRLYKRGRLPVEVRWALSELFPSASARRLSFAQRRAEEDIKAAEQAPPELKRAMVAAQRQEAIQGALEAGQWGAALKGLDRAGEIAGELRESAGLSEEDLMLTVTVEAHSELPEGDSQPVSGETGGDLVAETAETGGNSQG